MQTQITWWSDPIKRTPVCSQTEITEFRPNFERTTVWSWSDQGSIWSEKSDHRRFPAHFSLIINDSSAIGSDQKRIRAHLSLIINDSSAIGSDQKCFRAQLGLIRDHFECLIFFYFFVFFYWEMLALTKGKEATIKQSSDQWLIWASMALIRKRSPADSKEEILIN